jgi:uncharacterized delta-60 repeat protein
MVKTTTLLLVGALLLPAGWSAATAQRLDPSFASGTYYAPATAYSALEQTDGKRVLLGNFTRANSTPANHLARYTAAGAVDATFQQNLGTTSQVYRVAQLSNGQLLLTAFTNTPLVAGGITRNGLLRLNADGTADASFNPGAGPAAATSYNSIDYALPLPNGQVLVGGLFDHFNGVAINNLTRLNPDGSVDATFNADLGVDDEVEFMALLPGGKYLIGGFINGSASTSHGLVRLNPDGSRDATFNTNLQTYDEANYFLVQPDGKLLVAGGLSTAGSTDYKGLIRLLPDGSRDTSFTTPAALTNSTVLSLYGKALELQPDGKILVLVNTLTGAATKQLRYSLIRLNADGTLDNSFQTGAGANNELYSFTRLASGGILAAGSFTNFNGALDRPVVQLTSAGAIDPAFSPTLQVPGSVSSIVRQADGKLLVGGFFSEINGQAVRRLARLTTAGMLDASFTTTASDFDYSVGDVAVQPDGRLVLVTNNSVQRLMASGARDNSFTTPNFAGSNFYHLLLQPDGRVLVGGNAGYLNGVALQPPLLRLLADGSRDASFTPPDTGAGRFVNVFTLALQPNGKVLVAGNFAPTAGTNTIRTVARLESTGALDTNFANSAFTTFSQVNGINALAVQPDGKVLAGGTFTAVGGTPRVGLTRLNADGTPDAGFEAPFTAGTVYTLLLQPNGCILAGGSVRGSGVPNNLARLLPTGALDSSFGGTAVPNSNVFSLLAQPDGHLLLGGSFTALGGQPSGSIARLTGTNVLHVQAPQAVADRTTAWPVPAHSTLTVAPDASSYAQALDLLDVLGRPVRHQALKPGVQTTLTVEGLPAGTYLLRVSYAEGLVNRRIQVQ